MGAPRVQGAQRSGKSSLSLLNSNYHVEGGKKGVKAVFIRGAALIDRIENVEAKLVNLEIPGIKYFKHDRKV